MIYISSLTYVATKKKQSRNCRNPAELKVSTSPKKNLWGKKNLAHPLDQLF